VKGVSDNIHVRSIIGRFLEHTRVYYFLNNGEIDLWAGSADLMKRNLLRRVETSFPIEAKKLQAQVVEDLNTYLSDNMQAWLLSSDGRYQLVDKPKNEDAISAQMTLLEKMAKSY
jgi:polyphosphate kinase